jgi:hypothetical protein
VLLTLSLLRNAAKLQASEAFSQSVPEASPVSTQVRSVFPVFAIFILTVFDVHSQYTQQYHHRRISQFRRHCRPNLILSQR